MKKRIISFLLVMALVLSMAPMVTIEAEATADKVATNLELVERLVDIATNYKTLYVMGGWGGPLTESNKTRYINAHSYNQSADRKAMINAASSDTFAFDCVCLIKAVLWGWDGDLSNKNGGAVYATNGVPDINADSIITKCSEISTDFSDIEIGELVWMSGHVGIYIGDGLAVECSPAWDNCVQITACNQAISGYNTRNWTKHGKLPYVEYVSYLGECTQYPTCGTVKMTKAATLKSLPCSAATSEESKDVYAASVGESFAVTAIYQNSAGNYWYQTKYNNQTCYIYSGNVEHTSIPLGEVSMTGISAPSHLKKGESFPIKGLATSTSAPIWEIGAYLYQGPEVNYDIYMKSVDIAGKNTYELYNSKVDVGLKFNELPTGTYTYLVTAQLCALRADGNNLRGVWNQIFKLHESTFTVTETSGAGGSGCSCSTAYAGNYTCTATNLNLNIRSGHGTGYSVVGTIPPGATVYVSKASGTGNDDWAHVEYNGISGYASMGYLTKQTSGSVPDGTDSPIYFGIDVSHHQGAIDWDTVAGQIDFAIIRCGYGKNTTTQDDQQWRNNVEACTRLGIPFGVYLYSYATSEDGARSEAEHVLRLIEGYNPSLPIYYDLEDSSILENCSTADILNLAKVFCNTIEEAGYTAGIYANYNWWTNYLTSSEYDQWDRWIARYASETGYSKDYTIWQYTSSGQVDGINGNVDLNYWYGELPTNTHTHSYSSYVSLAPTCVTDGVMTHICQCGEGYTEAIPAMGHNYVGYTVDATCTQYGYIVYTCTNCGHSYESGEGYSEWSTTYPSGVDASRIESRTEYRYSDYHTFVSTTPNLAGYDLLSSAWQISGTGTNCYVPSWPGGFLTSHQVYANYSNEAIANWETSTNKVTVDSTTTVGYIYWHWCRGDYAHGPIDRKINATKTSEFDTFHAFFSTTAPAPQEEAWYYYHNGDCCKDTYWYFLLEVKVQNYTTYDKQYTYGGWSEWSAWSAEVYTESSTRKVETRTVYRYALGELADHDYQAMVVASTCTEQGYTTYTCVNCDHSYVGDYTEPTDHSFAVVEHVEPTCIYEGYTVYSCEACGHSYTEYHASPEHRWIGTVIAPTCTEQGYTAYVCERCGESYETDYVDALDHSYHEEVSSDGTTVYTCERCGDSYMVPPVTDVKVIVGTVSGKAGDTVEVVLTLENAPALRALGVMGITYDTDALTLISGEWLVEGALIANWDSANQTAAAAYTQNTDLNGAIFKLIFRINENAEAGDYTIGCTVTAKEKSGAVETVVPVATISGCVTVRNYVVGDMDGNDMLDTDDAIYLLYFTLFGESMYPIEQPCDFNGDGMVDTDDAIYLLYHTLFGDSMYPLN